MHDFRYPDDDDLGFDREYGCGEIGLAIVLAFVALLVLAWWLA